MVQHREQEVPPHLLRVQGQTLLIGELLDRRLGFWVVDHVDNVDMGGLHFLKVQPSVILQATTKGENEKNTPPLGVHLQS